MKTPGFAEGALVALALSAGASVLYPLLDLLLPGAWAWHALTAFLACIYILYLLSRSSARVGRISTLVLWATVTLTVLLLEPSLLAHVLAQLAMVWLIRSLNYYAGVLPALADLGLSALALAAGIWAADRTGSIFLSLWCLLLVQALFVAIPARLRPWPFRSVADALAEDRFERAHRAGERALRRL